LNSDGDRQEHQYIIIDGGSIHWGLENHGGKEYIYYSREKVSVQHQQKQESLAASPGILTLLSSADLSVTKTSESATKCG